MEVDDRRIYVTGGGSGIGLRLAEMLAARGAHVALFDLRLADEALRRVEAARTRTERRVRGYLADVADAAAIAQAFRQAAEELGPPDLVFNSAGISCPRAFVDISQQDFERVVRVNLFGSRNVAAAALPLLQPGSKLVFVASMAAVAPGYGYTAYGSSKAGVFGFAEALRSELAPRGIDVAVVCPPEVATPLVEWSRTVRPAPTEQLTRFAGSLGLDEACQAILRGILGRSFLVIPGRRANFAYFLSRVLPKRLAHAISDRIVARALADPGGRQGGVGGRAAD
jgi:NAD(P)-dependent dehydrogenase (short-subunit alcohol dehydrogenase family)